MYEIHTKHKFISFCWIPSHIGINDNDETDSHAPDCAGDSSRLSPYTKVTHSDFLPIIENTAVQRWQSDWDNCLANKLHLIKPCVLIWELSYNDVRKYEVLLTRLRIGHLFYLVYSWSPPSKIPIPWMWRLYNSIHAQL